MSLESERAQWEKEALSVRMPSSINCATEEIGGVGCMWLTDKTASPRKIIVYLHGGGLVAGSAKTHQHLAANIVGHTNCSVLLINYRLLPEHDYPVPLEDVLSVYRALLSNNHYLPNQLVLGGDSNGAGLALAALTSLRDASVPLPSKAFMVSGAFDMTLTSDSMRTNTLVDKDLSKRALKAWQTGYLNYDLESPLLSPLFADLSELPPLLLLAGGKDPWVSDSRNLAAKIEQLGGDVKMRLWDVMEHVFVMNPALNETTEALIEIANFVKE